MNTPQRIENGPGLPTIRYRSGSHGDFLASMLARLSADEYPALRALRTRDPRDFSIGLLDAFASAADVLTFYQERIATESYVRTAVERRSIVELGRLLGYQPGPGAAAETYLAFALDQTAGSPTELRLEAGLKVQSVPGPGEEPQTFETVEAITAQADWTSLRAETSTPHLPIVTDCVLEGTGLNLRPGDTLLFVGEEVEDDLTREQWDFRFIDTVTTDVDRDLTFVTWGEPLGSVSPFTAPAANPAVHVFRARSGVFGHNAPLWRAMPYDYRNDYGDAAATEWPDYLISPEANSVDLDHVEQAVTAGAWLVLAKPDYVELYRTTRVTEASRAAFAISGKVTRATLTGEHYELFEDQVRETTVFAAPEQLRFARRPVVAPVFDESLVLQGEHAGLSEGQALSLSGPRAHLRVSAQGQRLEIETAQGSRRLRRDEVLEVMQPPVRMVGSEQVAATPDEAQVTRLRWSVRDDQGREGTVDAVLGELELASAPDKAEAVSEVVLIDGDEGAVLAGDGRTVLLLEAATTHCYDPAGLVVNANVARATHGETVTQVLGSGNAARANQRFSLLRLPLTFVGADTETGVASTVQVKVNGSAWEERATLFDASAQEHVFTLRTDGETSAVVQFGDGTRGARLPTGRENVVATYRRGVGTAGNLAAGQVSQLMSRPLGLVGVTNPVPAAGGVDPDDIEDAREQIPLDVRTLGRTVSLRDYEDFARAFTGIAKARAAVLNLRAGRTIFITVAGEDGIAIPEDDPVLTRLVASLRAAGDPHVRFEVASYQPVSFRVGARIKRGAGVTETELVPRIDAALTTAFGFSRRSFGQPVVMSEAVAVIAAVDGVEAVDLEHLYLGSTPALATRLTPEPAHADASGRGVAAELLTIDADASAWLGDMA